ncbi:MAG: hypothetical protein N3F66_08465 [Spirochaetes bacterium]|nr:hypothetical protein [Spirochaetota bacterium]
MKLYVTVTFSCTNEQLALFVKKVVESGSFIRSINYISSDGNVSTFKADLMYSDRKLFKDKILSWLSKELTLIDCSDIMSKGIDGGLLKVASKIPFDSASEFEGKILGYIEIMKDNYITAETSQYTGMYRNCGMIILTENHKEIQPQEIYHYILIERDSLLLNHCSALNPQPLLVRYSTKEDILKLVDALAHNYAIMRIAIPDTFQDISLFQRLNEIKTLIISREYDEIPLYCLTKVMSILKRHHISLADSVIGIIGITTSSLRFARLLYNIGCSKVLGFDTNETNLYHFEKERGIATNTDNVFENADVVVCIADSCPSEEFYKLTKGQILLINPNINYDILVFQERGIKDYELLNIENSYLLLPGLAEKMINKQLNSLNDELLCTISKALVGAGVDIDNAESMYSIRDIILKI